MELLYVWIEDYKNIYHQGFNFSPRYRFDFTPTDEKGAEIKYNIKVKGLDEDKIKVVGGTLTEDLEEKFKNDPDKTTKIMEERKKLFPEKFFENNITNVTAIVGQNGAGKSNLIYCICHILNQLKFGAQDAKPGERIFDAKYIIVFGDKVYHNFADKVTWRDRVIVKFDPDEKHDLVGVLFSNVFDGREEKFGENVKDISTNSILLNKGSKMDSLTAYKLIEFKRQIDFINAQPHANDSNNKYSFNIPKKFDVGMYTELKWLLENESSLPSSSNDSLKEFKDNNNFVFYNLNNQETNLAQILLVKIFHNLIKFPFNSTERSKSKYDKMEKFSKVIKALNIKLNKEWEDERTKILESPEFINKLKKDSDWKEEYLDLLKTKNIINEKPFEKFNQKIIGEIRAKKVKNILEDEWIRNISRILVALRRDLISDIDGGKENYKKVKEILNLNGNDLQKEVKEILDSQSSKKNKNNQNRLDFILRRIIYTQNLRELIEFCKDMIEKIEDKGYDPKGNYITRRVEIDSKDDTLYKDFFKTFIELYTKAFTISETQFLYFDWEGMSSGELAMLNIASRFYSIKEKVGNDKTKPLLIFIDEGEVYLHAEWQKKFLKSILDDLRKIFDNKQIQIILTSHTPFVLSDIPKENVIFLKKATPKTEEEKYELYNNVTYAEGKCIVVDGVKQKQTFAANIHTLLSDSFFLQDGLMGEFAKGKIQEILEFYRRVKALVKDNSQYKDDKKKLKEEYTGTKNEDGSFKESNQEKFRKIQKMIGEEYLAQILKNHLEEIEWILFGEKPSRNDFIQKLVKEQYGETDRAKEISQILDDLEKEKQSDKN